MKLDQIDSTTFTGTSQRAPARPPAHHFTAKLKGTDLPSCEYYLLDFSVISNNLPEYVLFYGEK